MLRRGAPWDSFYTCVIVVGALIYVLGSCSLVSFYLRARPEPEIKPEWVSGRYVRYGGVGSLRTVTLAAVGAVFTVGCMITLRGYS